MRKESYYIRIKGKHWTIICQPDFDCLIDMLDRWQKMVAVNGLSYLEFGLRQMQFPLMKDKMWACNIVYQPDDEDYESL